MKTYIERAAVHDLVKSLPKYHMFSYDRTEGMIGINPDDVDFGVDKIPAADVTPVRHGRWIDSSNGWMCSVCERDSTYDTPYCPHCGALMDEKETEHEVSEP